MSPWFSATVFDRATVRHANWREGEEEIGQFGTSNYILNAGTKRKSGWLANLEKRPFIGKKLSWNILKNFLKNWFPHDFLVFVSFHSSLLCADRQKKRFYSLCTFFFLPWGCLNCCWLHCRRSLVASPNFFSSINGPIVMLLLQKRVACKYKLVSFAKGFFSKILCVF